MKYSTVTSERNAAIFIAAVAQSVAERRRIALVAVAFAQVVANAVPGAIRGASGCQSMSCLWLACPAHANLNIRSIVSIENDLTNFGYLIFVATNTVIFVKVRRTRRVHSTAVLGEIALIFWWPTIRPSRLKCASLKKYVC